VRGSRSDSATYAQAVRHAQERLVVMTRGFLAQELALSIFSARRVLVLIETRALRSLRAIDELPALLRIRRGAEGCSPKGPSTASWICRANQVLVAAVSATFSSSTALPMRSIDDDALSHLAMRLFSARAISDKRKPRCASGAVSALLPLRAALAGPVARDRRRRRHDEVGSSA
jgi:hypothetical protein